MPCVCLLERLELGLWTAVSHHEDAGNQTLGPCKAAGALNHLALPSTKEGLDSIDTNSGALLHAGRTVILNLFRPLSGR